MKRIILCWALTLSTLAYAQIEVRGQVNDEGGQPVFAANVYLKSDPEQGTTTDFDGHFMLNIADLNDILIISYVGFDESQIPLSEIADLTTSFEVTLARSSQSLDEVILTAKDPISEKFSVVKINKLDIYFNPVAQGDPLKAITILPASTTTDETANPSLRGSVEGRTRVVLNGVPVYNPVRASQLNNQGFFSLFNPEIIQNQYVYASNPPLTYGNTSAGLVEIQTTNNLNANQLQLSASLASTGFLLSQQIKRDTSFFQLYGNYQFSDAFIGIQPGKLPNLRKFYTKDMGLNFYHKLSKKVDFNSFNYVIDESFRGVSENFTYRGEFDSENTRFFSVNNLKLYSKNGVGRLNLGFNRANPTFNFGNTISDQRTQQWYLATDYKFLSSKGPDLQLGISYDYQKNSFEDRVPEFFYALSPESPSLASSTQVSNSILEASAYSSWDVGNSTSLSLGMRSNLPFEGQQAYLSWQLGWKYQWNTKHSFLLSGGKYHNYTTPNFFAKNFNLLNSYQLALDYAYKTERFSMTAALYGKREGGEQAVSNFIDTSRTHTLGLEFSAEYQWSDHWKFSFANSYIHQELKIDGSTFNGPKDFDYLIKATLQYNNPKLFTMALTFSSRPGDYFTEVTNATFDDQTGFFRPLFSDRLFGEQYGLYHRLDLTASKYITFGKEALVLFASLNNINDRQNERIVQYNGDYTTRRFDPYQLRTVYFGLVWQFNY